MPRTDPNNFAVALQSGSVRLGKAIGIIRKDGTVFGFTRGDTLVTLPSLTVGEITVASQVYRHDCNGTPTNVQLSADISKADNLEVSALLGDYVTESDVRKALFRGARWHLIWFNRDDLTQQWIILRGKVGQAKVNGQEVTFSLRSLAASLQQEIVDVTSPLSRLTWEQIVDKGYFSLSDDSADGHPVQITSTIDSVTTQKRVFTVEDTIGFPAGRFVEGTIEWTSGNNDGLVAQIMDWDEATGTITLWHHAPENITVGDAVTLTVKCPATGSEWLAIIGDLRYFGGEPGIPTIEAVSQVEQV